MSEHADTIRTFLNTDGFLVMRYDAVVALAALVAELAEGRREFDKAIGRNCDLLERASSAEAENARLKAALSEAVTVIDGLADQQAAPDDWYEEPRDRFAALASVREGDTA